MKPAIAPRSLPRVPDFATASEPRLPIRIYRFASVAWLALRIYLPYKAIQLWSRITGGTRKEARYRRQDLRAAQALYHTSIRLEGLLIKAGQFIATRADILPDEWVSTLAGLQDRVPPRPFAMIRAQIERELGRPLDQVFADFDPDADSGGIARPGPSRHHRGRPGVRGQGAVPGHRRRRAR